MVVWSKHGLKVQESLMKLKQVLQMAVTSPLLVLLWILVDPALAVVVGIMWLGGLSIAGLRSKPRWIKAFWSRCKDAALDKNGPWSW